MILEILEAAVVLEWAVASEAAEASAVEASKENQLHSQAVCLAEELKTSDGTFRTPPVLRNTLTQRIRIAPTVQTWKTRIVIRIKWVAIPAADFLLFLMDMEENKLLSMLQILSPYC